MKFSNMRHRIIFLKPSENETNSMHEIVPVWSPFKPTDTEYSNPQGVSVT